MNFKKWKKYLKMTMAATLLSMGVNTQLSADDTELKDTQNLKTIVVTASKAPMALEESASEITIIDADEIANKQYTTIADALRTVPGLDVRATGGYGSNTTIRMRGLHQQYTLVLIDGVKVMDSTGTNRSANIALMSTDNVERIEVVRGNQNILYGSSAIGGVVNIITKKAKKNKKLSGSIFSEYGSHNTLRYGGSFSTATKKVDLNVSVARETSDNISAADENVDGVDENDAYRNTSYSSKIGIAATENINIDLTARYNSGFYEFDQGAGTDDALGEKGVEQDEFFGRGQISLNLFDGKWKQIAGVNYTSIDREYFGSWRHLYENEIIVIDYKNIIELHETNTLTFGAETQEEIIRSGDIGSDKPKNTVRANSYFIEDQLRFWDKWFTTVGLRVNDHDVYHQHTTWKAATSYKIEKTSTTLKASYATGFYAPTLYNLFDSSSGNLGLEPERSRSWEIGFSQPIWKDKLNLEAMFFKNNIKNKIEYVGTWPTAKYENVAKIESKGLEVTLSSKLTKKLDATATYTYTKASKREPTRDIAFQPRNRGSLNINYSILPNLSAYTDITYTGSCYNGSSSAWAWHGNDTRFEQHTLMDIGINWDINKTFRLYGNCKNITDREYQEQAGYGTFGRTFTIGARATF